MFGIIQNTGMVKLVDALKHKSKITEGKYTGHYLVGIQLDDRLEHCV